MSAPHANNKNYAELLRRAKDELRRAELASLEAEQKWLIDLLSKGQKQTLLPEKSALELPPDGWLCAPYRVARYYIEEQGRASLVFCIMAYKQKNWLMIERHFNGAPDVLAKCLFTHLAQDNPSGPMRTPPAFESTVALFDLSQTLERERATLAILGTLQDADLADDRTTLDAAIVNHALLAANGHFDAVISPRPTMQPLVLGRAKDVAEPR